MAGRRCDVVVLHLGRESATGETRRVQTWQRLASSADACCIALPVLTERLPRPHPSGAPNVLRGLAVPETLAWSWRAIRRRIEELRPRVCIAVTSRAYHPELSGLGPRVILDHVDELSRSYRQRSSLAPNLVVRMVYRPLAWAHRRFEDRLRADGDAERTAAGYQDARRLGATWVPNVIEDGGDPTDARNEPTHDLLFMGNLTYEPNLDALRRIASFWPRLQERRPGTTLLVAGRGPARRVQSLAERWGWGLEVDFAGVAETCARARVALAPVRHTAGLQNKVLDAAACGLPQVVSPETTLGFAPGFPLEVAGEDDEWVAAVSSLLDDPARRADLGRRSREHALERYAPAAWVPWLREKL